MTENYITSESPEYWSPSVRLRWVEKETIVTTPSGTGIKMGRVLQQLWTSNLGKLEWKDVETVIEE